MRPARILYVAVGLVLVIAGSSDAAPRQGLASAAAPARSEGVQGMAAGPVVTGAPYSARGVTEFAATLADGTKIRRQSTYTITRDREGRLRREDGSTIWIVDPVARVSYLLVPSDRTAQEFPYVSVADRIGMTGHTAAAPSRVFDGGPNAMPNAPMTMRAMPGTAMRRGATTESLGARTIDGLDVVGRKTVSVLPAGSIGNDRPITVVDEDWFSNDLTVTVMSRTDDPRTGVTTFHLTEVHRGDPDPALFTVPGGYRVTRR